jgi:hypothetical protein
VSIEESREMIERAGGLLESASGSRSFDRAIRRDGKEGGREKERKRRGDRMLLKEIVMRSGAGFVGAGQGLRGKKPIGSGLTSRPGAG